MNLATWWFVIISIMLAVYSVLDGFDLGVGALHPWLGRKESEREIIVRSLGPVWDGNEVWLLAAGGVLVLAFPRVYASAFSGFYLPLMMVLWLLAFRAITRSSYGILATRISLATRGSVLAGRRYWSISACLRSGSMSGVTAWMRVRR